LPTIPLKAGGVAHLFLENLVLLLQRRFLRRPVHLRAEVIQIERASR
jgi:hypothetical protein